MSEFNLDNYQYTEEHITLNQFLQYLPQQNKFNSAAAFNGTFYQHQGEEWQHIMQLPAANIWTMYVDDEGATKIRNGYQVRGRLGYFECRHMHNAHATIIVDM